MTSLRLRPYHDFVTKHLKRKGALRIDLGSLQTSEGPQQPAESLEIVVPYTGLELTARVVERADTLAKGLNVNLKFVAVYVAPYPADLVCPAAMQEHLTGRVNEIAERTNLPSSAHVVAARDRDTGFRHVLRPASAVLMGSPKRLWRTREEKLARELVREGHHVLLLHFD